MRADRIEGEQQRQEDPDGEPLRVTHEQCSKDECADRGEEGRSRCAASNGERQRDEQEQHREDASATDHVRRGGRVPPKI